MSDCSCKSPSSTRCRGVSTGSWSELERYARLRTQKDNEKVCSPCFFFCDIILASQFYNLNMVCSACVY
jgi:hypothetical protein